MHYHPPTGRSATARPAFDAAGGGSQLHRPHHGRLGRHRDHRRGAGAGPGGGPRRAQAAAGHPVCVGYALPVLPHGPRRSTALQLSILPPAPGQTLPLHFSLFMLPPALEAPTATKTKTKTKGGAGNGMHGRCLEKNLSMSSPLGLPLPAVDRGGLHQLHPGVQRGLPPRNSPRGYPPPCQKCPFLHRPSVAEKTMVFSCLLFFCFFFALHNFH